MHVPVNKVVRVNLKSQDVIHSFFVPQFRMKQDAVPGREIAQWFEVTEARQVRAAVRRAVRLRALGHAGLDLRAHAGGVREVGGGEPAGAAAPAARRPKAENKRRVDDGGGKPKS